MHKAARSLIAEDEEKNRQTLNRTEEREKEIPVKKDEERTRGDQK